MAADASAIISACMRSLSASRFDVAVRTIADMRAEWRWRRTDRHGPLPNRAKRRLLRSYARAHGIDILIETGTYLGDTVAALRRDFQRIYSIELGHDLARAAQARFNAAANVTILEGDSGKLLPELLRGLSAPALFWLDGHYSAGITARGGSATPLLAELEAVLSHRVADHVLLVDDATWLDQELGPNGLDEIRRRISAARPTWSVAVRNDILRAVPPSRDGASGPA